MKRLLSGNEAVARGLWEAGAIFAAAYPGTPSTEILENASRYKEIEAQWAPNEKVAYEVACGVAMGGGRALAAMKHVGVNVAADPLFSSSYTGVAGGLIVVSADDPFMFSSQNEQDNRNLAKAAKIAMLEPSDSQEAKDLVKIGFEISEKFDTPVMLRVTTRLCHSMTVVDIDQDLKYEKAPSKPYKSCYTKYVLLPSNARQRHIFVEDRLKKLEAYSNEATNLNRIEWGDKDIGIITSGVSYQYVKEALPDASVLKLALTNPIPRKLIRDFALQVKRLYVVEELDPYLEEQIKAIGIAATGKEVLPNVGEFSAGIVANALGVSLGEDAPKPLDVPLPVRPPVMCPGCSHRGIFYTLNKMKLIVTGDIGCYTLGAYPPLVAMDSCVCMGASVGMAHGMGIALSQDRRKKKLVGVIGDSTFVHSGITGLINAVYNKGLSTIIILDNFTTAMTGHQNHPATGVTLSGEKTHQLDLAQLCRSIGVKRVKVIDPYDLIEIKSVLKEELAAEEASVVISRAPCVLLRKSPFHPPATLAEEYCEDCGLCYKLGCPAIEESGGKPIIDPSLCCGCTLCVQVCNLGALSIEGYEPKKPPKRKARKEKKRD